MTTTPDATFENAYLTGQLRPTFPALFETFGQANERVLSRLPFETDLVYGPHERQRYDLCASVAATQSVVVYLHAGYWQSRDKSQFRFLAERMHASGLTLALVNYPLCPEVSVSYITQVVQEVIPAIQSRLSHLSQDTPWVLCGHSAGAHLAAEMALSLQHVPSSPNIQGVLGISGVYELSPLVHTSLNVKLKLDEQSAKAASVVRRIQGRLPPAIFATGGLETTAFHQQSANIANAWQQAGNQSRHLILPDEDHFSILMRQEITDWLLELSRPIQ